MQLRPLTEGGKNKSLEQARTRESQVRTELALIDLEVKGGERLPVSKMTGALTEVLAGLRTEID